MRWGELREGDALLCPNGKVWLVLACEAAGEANASWCPPYPVVSLELVDLETGRRWSALQNDSRADAWGEGEVLRAV